MIGVHPAWLPASAFRAIGSRRTRVLGEGPVVATVRGEIGAAAAEHGGALVDDGPVDLELVCAPDAGETDPEAFVVGRAGTTTVVRAVDGPGCSTASTTWCGWASRRSRVRHRRSGTRRASRCGCWTTGTTSTCTR